MTAIHLQPLETHHVELLFKAGSNGKIWKYLTSKPKSYKDFEEYVFKELKDNDVGLSIPFVIRHSSEVIGFTKLYDINEKHYSLSCGGTWISPSFWGKGINLTLKLLILEYCFEKISMRRVQYVVDENNTYSQKSLQKTGATFEGIIRNYRYYSSGLYKNIHLYSHIVDEWEDVKKRLRKVSI